jgi:hypothetical protein
VPDHIKLARAGPSRVITAGQTACQRRMCYLLARPSGAGSTNWTKKIFKAYAVQSLVEGTSFVQDLKLGHYIKLSPRSTFTGMLSLIEKNVFFLNRAGLC